MELQTHFIRYEKGITEEGYKLICLPYAGGGASTFVKWQAAFGNRLEVLPVQLPGRENRVAEPLIQDFQEAVDQVYAALSPYVKDHNFSIFGHSMGGIIGFALARRFEEAGCYPDFCFISATSLEDKSLLTKSKDLDDDEFFQRVSDYGGIDTSSEILQYPEFKEIFLKTLRADFNLIESYPYEQGDLQCPIVGFCGTEDPMESPQVMESWKDHTASGAEFHTFPGGHFYFMEEPKPLCDTIARYIGQREVSMR